MSRDPKDVAANEETRESLEGNSGGIVSSKRSSRRKKSMLSARLGDSVTASAAVPTAADGNSRNASQSYDNRPTIGAHTSPNISTPGAVAVRGIDDNVRISTVQVDREAEDSASSTPITARVVEHDEEALLETIQQLRQETQDLQAQRQNVVHAEATPLEENVSRGTSCLESKRARLALVAICVVVVAVVAIVLGVVLSNIGGGGSDGGEDGDPIEVSPELYNLIASASPDTGAALANSSSPQYQALFWLAGNANLDTYSDQKKKHRYAMASFYYSTNGDEWVRNDRWLSNDDECGWYRHITDDAFQPPTCDDQGVISVIALPAQNLNGTLPPELALLTDSLDFLNLGNNALLTGPIPSAMGLLTDFRQLLLFNTAVHGPVPTEIGRMTKLDHLNLRDARHTGSLPTELGQLKELGFIQLEGNLLTGTLPSELGGLVALSSLNLKRNSLTSSIPSEIGLLRALTSLDLSSNMLTGRVPNHLNLLTNLKKLRLNGNMLNGTCPSQVEDCRI